MNRLGNVFICYASADSDHAQKLTTHLRPYDVGRKLRICRDVRIQPGNEWEVDLISGLKGCSVAILLLSNEFLSSEFIQAKELKELKYRFDKKEVILLPVNVRSNNGRTITPWLWRIQGPLPPTTCISDLTSDEREAAWTEVARQTAIACVAYPYINQVRGLLHRGRIDRNRIFEVWDQLSPHRPAPQEGAGNFGLARSYVGDLAARDLERGDDEPGQLAEFSRALQEGDAAKPRPPPRSRSVSGARHELHPGDEVRKRVSRPVRALASVLVALTFAIGAAWLWRAESGPSHSVQPTNTSEFETRFELYRSACILSDHDYRHIPESNLYLDSPANNQPKTLHVVLREINPKMASLYAGVKDGKPVYYQKMAIVSAPAGAGKTSLVRELSSWPGVVSVDLTEMADKDRECDLPSTSGRCLTELPGLGLPRVSSLTEERVTDLIEGRLTRERCRTESPPCHTIVFDALDEVGPDSSQRLLRLAARYVNGPGPRKNIVIFGRVEAFYDFYLESRDSGIPFEHISLPSLRLMSGNGESTLLKWYVRQTLEYLPARRDGGFPGVLASEPQIRTKVADELVERMENYARRNPELPALMYSGEAATNIIQRFAPGEGEPSIAELRRGLVRSLLERSERTHGRPVSRQCYLEGLCEAVRSLVLSLPPPRIDAGMTTSARRAQCRFSRVRLAGINLKCSSGAPELGLSRLLNRSGVLSLVRSPNSPIYEANPPGILSALTGFSCKEAWGL